MSNAHTPADLILLQQLPLEAKIRMTKERIKGWYESWQRFEIHDTATGKTRYVTYASADIYDRPPMKETEYIESAIPGQVYVSFSGGKDSTVLKHIVDSMYDDVPSLFVNTGLEYPEIQRFAMSQKNVVTVRPDMRFDEVIKKYGYPVISKAVSNAVHYAKRNIAEGKDTLRLRQLQGIEKNHNGGDSKFNKRKWQFLLDAPFEVHNECCNIMKKKPFASYETETERKPFIGTLATESTERKVMWEKYGCNAFEKGHPSSQPLSFWTEQDILQYIKKYDVPYCSVYGDITDVDGKLTTTDCDRTGCVYCLFGIHREDAPNRMQRMKETHPRQYEYCIGGGAMADGKWQPNKEGLGLGKVLDYIGVKYD